MADFQEQTIASVQLTLGEDVAARSVLMAIKTTDTEGYKAADTANLVVVGRNELTGDEDDVITAVPGKFLVTNSTTYPVTQAHIGSDCYIEDETTVASSGGSNSIVAGTVIDVVTAGVWVAVGIQ